MVWLQMMGWKKKKKEIISKHLSLRLVCLFIFHIIVILIHIYTHIILQTIAFLEHYFRKWKQKPGLKSRGNSAVNSPQLLTPHPLVGMHSHCSLPGSCWESKPMNLNKSCELQLRSSGSLLRAFNSDCVCGFWTTMYIGQTGNSTWQTPDVQTPVVSPSTEEAVRK